MKQKHPRHKHRIHSEEFQLIHIRNPHSRYSGLVRLGWLLPRIEQYLVMEQLGQQQAPQLLWSQIRMNAVHSAEISENRINWYTSNGVGQLRELVQELIYGRIRGELRHRRTYLIQFLRTDHTDHTRSAYQGHSGQRNQLVLTQQIEFTSRWPKIAREIQAATQAVLDRNGIGGRPTSKEPSIEPQIERTWARIRRELDRG